MRKDNLNHWVQLLTSVAVLAGLGLVVWELRQSHNFARLQYASEAQSDQANQRLTLQGESVYETLVRACYNEADLTRDDAVILDAYFNAQMGMLGRLLLGREIALDNDWRQIGERQIRLVVRFPQGEQWLRSDSWWGNDPAVQELLEEALKKGAVASCAQDFDRLLQAPR